MQDIQPPLLQYIDFYETLKPNTVAKLRQLVSEDVAFKDPFNSIIGVDAYIYILKDMYSRCDQPCFNVDHWAIKDQIAYIKWTFSFRPKNMPKKSWVITGMSEIVFNGSGLIIEHTDYWDPASQLYERLPVIGIFFKWLRKKFKAV